MKLVMLAWLMMSCVSPDTQQQQPPQLTLESDVEEAVDAAVKFGGPTLEFTKQIIREQKKQSEAVVRLDEKLNSSTFLNEAPDSQLINTMNLLKSVDRRPRLDLFKSLIKHDRVAVRDMAWNIAANHPSKRMAALMESELTQAVTRSTEDRFLHPQMAVAVRQNQLKSAYTFVRLGLYEKGDDEFAKAMAALDPEKASDDFLPYLAKASVEELRQLNQTNINMYTCIVILQHLNIQPATIAHPLFSQLFLYAVSRNPGFSDLASMAIDKLMPAYKAELAQLLAQQPAWVQLSYVEGTKRRRSTYATVFLNELKTSTTHEEVSEEIDDRRPTGPAE